MSPQTMNDRRFEQQIDGGKGAPTVRLGMVSWMVAGIRTHYLNIRGVADTLPHVAVRPFEITPFIEGGAIERLPLLPNRLKANLRCQTTVLPLLGASPLDAVWTQTSIPVLPFLFTRALTQRIPVVYDADSTPRLLAAFGNHYTRQVEGTQFKQRAVDALYHKAFKRMALIVPWSRWAAASLIGDYGVSEERIRIIPPGVHLREWASPPGARDAEHSRLPRLLFVGADFERKGGSLLLEVYREHFAGRCELHLVTKAPIVTEPGVHVYRDFTPNDPGLRQLYHTSDALVLPTQADCFSLASIEAMASELPVITTAVGGIPEIVADGESGYLITPNNGRALRHAIDSLLGDVTRRQAMGARGRHIAETRYDASKNAQLLLASVCALAGAPSADEPR